ncbi:MAG: hypothetical protein ACTSPY_02535 [Candidatus Helarchaeota archaeon]
MVIKIHKCEIKNTELGSLILNNKEGIYTVILEFSSNYQENIGLQFMKLSIEDFKLYLDIISLIQDWLNFDNIHFDKNSNDIIFKKSFTIYNESRTFFDKTYSLLESLENFDLKNDQFIHLFFNSNIWW